MIKLALKKLEEIHPLTIVFILFGFYFTLVYLGSNIWLPLRGDASRSINDSIRFFHGELPYRDFWYFFPPGELILSRTIYTIFGLNVTYPTFLSLVIATLVGLVSYLLSRLVYKVNSWAIITSVIIFFNGISILQGNFTFQTHFLLLLIAAIFIFRYREKYSLLNIFFAGLFVGLSVIFRIYESGAAVLAFLITIYLIERKQGKKFRHFLKSFTFFIATILTVLIIIFYLERGWITRVWPLMLRETLIGGISQAFSINLPYFSDSERFFRRIFIDIYQKNTTSIIFNLAMFSYISFLYLLPFLIVVGCIYYLFKLKVSKIDKLNVSLFLFWGIFTFPKVLSRADVAHLSYALNPMLFLPIFFVVKSLKTDIFIRKVKVLFTCIILVLFFPAIFLTSQTVYNFLSPKYYVTAKYGSLSLTDKSEVNDLNQVIDFIEKSSNEEEYLFVTPWFAPPLNALTGRRIPTFYDSLSLVNEPSIKKQSEICEELLSYKTKIIIHNPNWGIDDRPDRTFQATNPYLEDCIGQNFFLREKYGKYWVYNSK